MLHAIAPVLVLLILWQQTGLDLIRQEAIRDHLHYLASDALEGRATGSRGHRLAAEYVARNFQAMRLEPAGDDKTYFQTMTIRRSELVGHEFRLTVNGSTETLVHGRDLLAVPDALRSEASAEGSVVFAGHGLVDPEFRHDDYAGLNVHGKIVIVLAGAPGTFPEDYHQFIPFTTLKEELAAARGAVGLITIRDAEAERRAPWSEARVRAARTQTRWYDGQSAHESFKPLQLVATMSRAAARRALGGEPGSLRRPFETNATLSVRTRMRHEDVQSPNVVAILRGSDAALRDEYVVYTAHLDHEGIGRPVNGDAIYNGALDNAVSVSMLLEAARALAQSGDRPKRSFIFVATTAEEEGLLGADYFVHHPPVPLENIVANINMDATLALFPLKDYVALGGEHSTLGPIFNRAAARLGIDVSPDPFAEEQFFLRSDHFQFVLKGIPAMFPSEGIQTTDPTIDSERIARRWLAEVYHTPKDDLSQPFNYESMRKQAQFFYLFGYLVGNESRRPRWNDTSFFGKLPKLKPKL